MESINQILVISRLTPYSRKAIQFGVSLARRYDAGLKVLHLGSNPVDMMAVNAPGLFPKEEQDNYKKSQWEAKKQLDKVIKQEISDGIPIKELTSDQDTVEEIVKVVGEEKIDLLIMLAHEVGRLEHVLFGGDNDSIIRRIPCSILLVKNEPDPVEW